MWACKIFSAKVNAIVFSSVADGRRDVPLVAENRRLEFQWYCSVFRGNLQGWAERGACPLGKDLPWLVHKFEKNIEEMSVFGD